MKPYIMRWQHWLNLGAVFTGAGIVASVKDRDVHAVGFLIASLVCFATSHIICYVQAIWDNTEKLHLKYCVEKG